MSRLFFGYARFSGISLEGNPGARAMSARALRAAVCFKKNNCCVTRRVAVQFKKGLISRSAPIEYVLESFAKLQAVRQAGRRSALYS